MASNSKLYLIVREDLSPAQQAVQAAHALRQWVEECPEQDQLWFNTSNCLALVTVPNEREIKILYERALIRGIPTSMFREPDRGNEVTSIVIAPTGRNICKHLPLALK